VYEVHVKGLTARHPDIAPELRGTYAALASPPIVEHFKKLGVTAVELLPVHQFVHSQILESKQLRNYWGYDSSDISRRITNMHRPGSAASRCRSGRPWCAGCTPPASR